MGFVAPCPPGFRGSRLAAKPGCFEAEAPRFLQLPGSLLALPSGPQVPEGGSETLEEVETKCHSASLKRAAQLPVQKRRERRDRAFPPSFHFPE